MNTTIDLICWETCFYKATFYSSYHHHWCRFDFPRFTYKCRAIITEMTYFWSTKLSSWKKYSKRHYSVTIESEGWLHEHGDCKHHDYTHKSEACVCSQKYTKMSTLECHAITFLISFEISQLCLVRLQNTNKF